MLYAFLIYSAMTSAPSGRINGKHAGQTQLLLFGDVGPENLVDVMDAGLHGYNQVAVRRGHDDGQNACQRQTRQPNGKNLDGQRRDHRISGAVLGQLFRRNQLMRHHAHEPHQRDGQAVYKGAEEQTLFGGFPASGGKSPLPHFRACQREDKIGDDVADDAAIQIGFSQLRSQIFQKNRQAAQLGKGGDGEQDVHKQNQHHKLEHIRIDDAEQTRGGGVNDENHAGNQRPQLIGNADFGAQHVDDGGGGRNLRGHGAHHGEGNHAAQNHLGCFAEALLEQIGNGGDIKGGAHGGDAPGEARENKHTQQVGQRRHNGFKAAGIGHACPAHQTAAADDGGADGGHQHQRAKGTAAQIVIIGALHLFHHHNADGDHRNEVGGNDAKVNSMQFVVYHVFGSPFCPA